VELTDLANERFLYDIHSRK